MKKLNPQQQEKKKMSIFVSLALSFLLVLALPLSLAQTTQTTNVPSGLEMAIQNIHVQILQIFNKQNAAQTSLEYAAQRANALETLAESQASQAEINNMNDKRQKMLTTAQVTAENIKDEEQRIQVEEKVAEQTQKHQQILERVINKIRTDDNEDNDAALEGLERAKRNAELMNKRSEMSVSAIKQKMTKGPR